jgi:hypothetical protein
MGVGGRRHAVVALTPEKKIQCTGSWVGHRRSLDGYGKPPPPEFDPRIPTTSELLYRLRTSVQRIQKRGKENIQWKQRSKKKYKNRKRKGDSSLAIRVTDITYRLLHYM